jgi:hypothetical protein
MSSTQPGDHAERAETDRQRPQIEVRAVDGQQRAIGGHQVDGGHGRGQDPVAVAGTMGAGGGRTGHRDMRQGAGVVQRVPLRLQLRGQDPVAGAAGHRHRHRVGVDSDVRRQLRQRDQRPAGGICNGVEGVSRTDGFDPRMLGDQLLYLSD